MGDVRECMGWEVEERVLLDTVTYSYIMDTTHGLAVGLCPGGVVWERCWDGCWAWVGGLCYLYIMLGFGWVVCIYSYVSLLLVIYMGAGRTADWWYFYCRMHIV